MGKIILESKKLVKAYSNGANKLDVINNLNLKVQSSEIITIVGQSGCGKTTLLNLIGGLDRSGFWRINGFRTKYFRD